VQPHANVGFHILSIGFVTLAQWLTHA